MFLPHTHKYTESRGHRETFGGDGYVYYLDCCDSIRDVCMYPNSPKCLNIHSFIFIKYTLMRDFPGGSVVRNLPANAGDEGSIPGLEDHLEKEMAIHFSILDWKIPWTEEPCRLQSMGSQSQTQLSN